MICSIHNPKNGTIYYLHSVLAWHKKATMYYFSKELLGAVALPDIYEVVTQPKNGYPRVRKKKPSSTIAPSGAFDQATRTSSITGTTPDEFDALLGIKPKEILNVEMTHNILRNLHHEEMELKNTSNSPSVSYAGMFKTDEVPNPSGILEDFPVSFAKDSESPW